MHQPVWKRSCRLRLEQWSPEQISGRLERCQGVSVSTSWIYRLVRRDRAEGGIYYFFLRQRGQRRRPRADRAGAASCAAIPGRRDSSERPAIVDSKTCVGDWAGDTILGKAHHGVAVTLVERNSKYLLAKVVPRKTAALVGGAVQDLLQDVAALVQTLTFDNGSEFAGHQQIAAKLAARIYFARPYRSCERGLSEHTNGLLRGFVSKTENLRQSDPQRILEAASRLNHRPRKVLNYRPPMKSSAPHPE